MGWQPKDSDFLAAINNQNPWHAIERVPEELSPATRRPLADILWQILLRPPLRRHQVIIGPRRVGKTTVMHQTVQQLLSRGVAANKLWWLRLDHPLLLGTHLGELVKEIVGVTEATPSDPTYLFLDELTYANHWDLWLKTFFDEQWPVRIVATNSATAALRQKGTESGVGRWEEQFLAPYLFTEYLDLKNAKDGYSPRIEVHDTLAQTLEGAVAHRRRLIGLADHRRRFIITGGFPELLIRPPSDDEASDIFHSQRILRSDAIEKAIYKDVPQAFSIQDPVKLERLLYSLAGQIAQIFSPATLAADLELAAKTLEKYTGFLERAFLIFMLPTYSTSEETVQRRGKKLYFVDGAVRNAALLRGLAPLNDPAEMGLLMENAAAAHLHALAYQSGIRLYHWRHKGSEVDLVFDHPEEPLAFEVTVSTHHHAKGIREFQERFGRFRGNCYMVYPDAPPKRPTFDEPGRIPLDLFLVAVGRQTQYALERRVGAKRSTTGQLTLFERPN